MKILKRIGISLILIILLLEIALLATGNTYVNKVLALTIFSGKMSPDIDEVNAFPFNEVKADSAQPWPYAASYNQSTINNAISDKINYYQTVALLVIKNDSLLYEQYWENYDSASVANSFSMAKSITGMLIGCAVTEGLIKNIDEPVGNYLPEFTEGEKSKITIRHFLTMSSGLDFKEDYVSPLAWPAESYYGPDVNTLTLKADVVTAPGKVWHYKGGDTQLLGMILKKVTGKTVAAYATEKLWKPIGAEKTAFWSIDDKGMEKVSCCWYTNARDFARLAKLMMQYGKWNGKQIIDSAYVAESVIPANLVDREGKPNNKYGFKWWLMEHKGHPIFYMRGIRGQYVFAIPSLNLIVVRYGHRRAPKAGDELPEDIFVYLDAALDISESTLQ
jgi:CubicO group peptidase (beta-lactamase class C family)